MRKYLSLALLLLAAISARAQQTVGSYSNPLGGQVSVAGANCSAYNVCVWQKLPATATTTTVTISGTFSATLIIETSADGGNTFTQQSSQTAAVVVTFTTTSLTDVRVRCSAFTSGIAQINIQTSGNQLNVNITNTTIGGGGSGASLVTTGLLADCPINEGTGTTLNCGSAGSATFGAGNAAPVWINQSGLGTVLAMDNFTNAALTTAGNWTVNEGTWTISGGTFTPATVAGGDSLASAVYTGLPPSQNQWCQFTFATTPTVGSSLGCTLRGTAGTATYYFFGLNPTTWFLNKVIAGSSTPITTGSRTTVAGDVVYFQIVEQPSLTTATLIAKVNGSVISTTTDSSIWQGVPGIVGTVGTGTGKNFLTGNLNQSSQTNGLVFGGGQNVSLSLTSPLTLEVYGCFQRSSNTNSVNGLIASSNVGLVLSGQATTGNPLVTTVPHILITGAAGAVTTADYSTLNGCGLATATFGNSSPTSMDHVYLNGQEANPYVQLQQGTTASSSTTGTYLIGGQSSGPFTGTIYRVRAFNRVLSPQEAKQDALAMNQIVAGSGVVTASYDNSNNDSLIVLGDSLSSGFGLGTPASQAWPQVMTLVTPSNSLAYGNGGKPWPQAITASQLCGFASNSSADPVWLPLLTTAGGRNTVFIYSGTNDLVFNGASYSGTLLGCFANVAKAAHAAGAKVIVASIISRGASGACTFDTNKDTFNPVLRANWSTIADGFVDFASKAAFADGACTSANYQADNVHNTTAGEALKAAMAQRGINRLNGGIHSFSEATTYSTSATQADQDVYFNLAGATAAQTFTLESCEGYTGQNLYGKNSATGAGTWSIAAAGSETIDGTATYFFPVGSQITLQSILTSNTAGGCSWKVLPQTNTVATATNCAVNSASPAACGSASSGVFAVPTTTTTYTINTTAVTANSRIFLEDLTDNTGIPSAPTCTALSAFGLAQQTSRVAGTSFTISLPSTAGTTCFSYLIVN